MSNCCDATGQQQAPETSPHVWSMFPNGLNSDKPHQFKTPYFSNFHYFSICSQLWIIVCPQRVSIIFGEQHPVQTVAPALSNALISERFQKFQSSRDYQSVLYFTDLWSAFFLRPYKAIFFATFVFHFLLILYIPDIVNLSLNKPSQAMTNSHGEQGWGVV